MRRFVLDNTLHLVPQLHDDDEGCTEMCMEGSPVVYMRLGDSLFRNVELKSICLNISELSSRSVRAQCAFDLW